MTKPSRNERSQKIAQAVGGGRAIGDALYGAATADGDHVRFTVTRDGVAEDYVLVNVPDMATPADARALLERVCARREGRLAAEPAKGRAK